MRLTLAIHPVNEIRFANVTRLDGSRLQVNQEELRRHLLEDRRLRSVDLEIARPGESCRAGILADVVEPRAKEPGSGADFPGILGPHSIAGQGTTHVLRGAAVTLLDEGAAPGAAGGGRVLEMSGPVAAFTPYSSLQHLIVAPHAAPDLERHRAQNAFRVAMLKAAVYLAWAAQTQPPASTEVFDLGYRDARDGLPRVAYIGQIYGHQIVAEVDEQILYGSNTAGLLPTPLHPNEWLDGAVVCSANFNMSVETYWYQNHPIVTELYRRHDAGELIFAGTIATVAASREVDRNRSAALAAHLAKWDLRADAAVLTKYGGGAPHVDLGLTAHLCEQLGVRTAVQVNTAPRDQRAESALMFNYADVNAIVYVGGVETRWAVPAAERVITASPTAKAVLGAPQDLAASNVAGIINQQGASHLTASLR